MDFLPKKNKRRDQYRIWSIVALSLVTLLVIGSVAVWNSLSAPFSDQLTFGVSGPTQDTPIVGGDVTVPVPSHVVPRRPERVAPFPDDAQFSAHAIVVKDVESGALLYNRRAYEPRPIASITKLMSALVILDQQPDWNEQVVVVGGDAMGTHMYAGDVYTVHELWEAALVGSSNKAIFSLASHYTTSTEAFVALMNDKARELGMSETTFADATGLDAGNRASASDVALLLQEAMSHTEIVDAVQLEEVALFSEQRNKSHRTYNTNWLLLGWIQHPFAEIVGGKTGFIPAAGYNFSMEVVGDNGRHLFVVVLGTDNHEARFTEARDIASWAFSSFTWPDTDSVEEE